jgi:hypothetical protein
VAEGRSEKIRQEVEQLTKFATSFTWFAVVAVVLAFVVQLNPDHSDWFTMFCWWIAGIASGCMFLVRLLRAKLGQSVYDDRPPDDRI